RCATALTSGASPSSSRASPRSAATRRRRSKRPSWKRLAKKRCAMSDELDLSFPDPGSLQRGRFTYFPVVPGKLEFAIEVRRAILRDKPQVIAVELPTTLRDAYLRAVERLPEMSVILYNDEQEEDRAVYVPVEPADPFTEAIRSGREI